ncbi:MAG: GyrI-like domain-containing protein [Planctomycetales bacterium]|nr:GyrI-like domain-containing protein [bacterium]UNM08578.1 MAG: GyrI-like domain-containing protein [Planctomycetales bacterium]
MDAAAQGHRIEELPAWTGAGLMIDCPGFDGSGIAAVWEKFSPYIYGGTEHVGIFGISLPLPENAPGFRYWAVMKLRPGQAAPAGLDTVNFPASRFAVWHFHDHPSQLPVHFQDIYNNRLKGAGLASALPWMSMEHYGPDWHDEAAGRFRLDLWIAIS